MSTAAIATTVGVEKFMQSAIGFLGSLTPLVLALVPASNALGVDFRIALAGCAGSIVAIAMTPIITRKAIFATGFCGVCAAIYFTDPIIHYHLPKLENYPGAVAFVLSIVGVPVTGIIIRLGHKIAEMDPLGLISKLGWVKPDPHAKASGSAPAPAEGR